MNYETSNATHQEEDRTVKKEAFLSDMFDILGCVTQKIGMTEWQPEFEHIIQR